MTDTKRHPVARETDGKVGIYTWTEDEAQAAIFGDAGGPLGAVPTVIAVLTGGLTDADVDAVQARLTRYAELRPEGPAEALLAATIVLNETLVDADTAGELLACLVEIQAQSRGADS